jgi:mannose-6-phosphate isomerase-like protein (cupin superfamily)
MNLVNIATASKRFEILQKTDKSQTGLLTLKTGEWSNELGSVHPVSDQIVLVLSGRMQGEVGEERATLNVGDVLIIPPGVPHRFQNVEEEPCVSFNVYAPAAFDRARG